MRVKEATLKFWSRPARKLRSRLLYFQRKTYELAFSAGTTFLFMGKGGGVSVTWNHLSDSRSITALRGGIRILD